MSQIRLDLPKVRLKFNTEPSHSIEPTSFPEYDPGPAVFIERLKMSREMRTKQLRGRKMKRKNQLRLGCSKHIQSRYKAIDGRAEGQRYSVVKRRHQELSTEFELARQGQHCTISQEEVSSMIRRYKIREYAKELKTNIHPKPFFRRDSSRTIESMPLIHQHFASLPPQLSGQKMSYLASPNASKIGSPTKRYRRPRRQGSCPTVNSTFQLDPWQSRIAPSSMGDSTMLQPC